MILLHTDTGTSELARLSIGGTAGVTTGTVFAAENGGRNIPTAVNFPFYDNTTTSAFVSCLEQSQSLCSLLYIHTYSMCTYMRCIGM